jgi:heptaprenyl diphosphate synthase
MTRSTISLKATPADHHLARLAALAIGLSIAEAGVPSPLPGVKPGLANIVTLVVLERHGIKAAAWVSLLRVVAGSFALGTFLAPAFVLSFCGAVSSLAVLGLACCLSRRWFGPVTQSILASFAHIAGQLGVVYIWLIPHSGLFYLVPVFAAAALLFGTVNGVAAAHLLERNRLFGVELTPQTTHLS